MNAKLTTRNRRAHTFRDVAIGGFFRLNGNVCIKRSTRTAEMVEYQRRFYFAANEQVVALTGREYTLIDTQA